MSHMKVIDCFFILFLSHTNTWLKSFSFFSFNDENMKMFIKGELNRNTIRSIVPVHHANFACTWRQIEMLYRKRVCVCVLALSHATYMIMRSSLFWKHLKSAFYGFVTRHLSDTLSRMHSMVVYLFFLSIYPFHYYNNEWNS